MTNVIKKIYKNGTEYDIYATAGAAGTGDVTGPSSATDGHLAVFDGTTGKIIKDGGAVPSYSSSDFDIKDLADSTGLRTTWSNKQDALSTQTAYTTKGTSTKVATISTNTLGQVTAITETSIDFPVSSVNGSTGAVTVSEFNPGGTATTGYVVRKTANGYGWDEEAKVLTKTEYGQLTPVSGKIYFIKQS